ncbi:MAG: hypothetical protein ACOCTT_01705 [archaeon]
MNKKILKNKAEGIIKRESTKSKFEEEHREKALKEITKLIEEEKIKRFNDLKNKVKKTLSDIAEEESIEYYGEK